MRTATLIAAGVGMAILLCAAAQAQLVTIAIEAEVTFVEDGSNIFGGQITTGSKITGTYTYDSLTADSNPAENYGAYYQQNPLCGIFLRIASFDFRSDADDLYYHIGIANDHPSLHDSYFVNSNNNLQVLAGVGVDNVSWELGDPTSMALSSVELLATAPPQGVWATNKLNISTDRLYAIEAYVTSAVVVPEPATVILLAFGAGLLRIRRRQ